MKRKKINLKLRIAEIRLLNKTLSALLLGAMLMISSGFQIVLAQTVRDAQTIENTRTKVRKFGIGEKARVKVNLADNKTLKGFISAAEQDSFTLTDSKTGATQTVVYSEVKDISKQSGGLSPLTWGIIGGVAAAAVIIGLTVVKPVLCDGGAGC